MCTHFEKCVFWDENAKSRQLTEIPFAVFDTDLMAHAHIFIPSSSIARAKFGQLKQQHNTAVSNGAKVTCQVALES